MRPKFSLLVLVSLVAAAGGFLFGYDTAVINGANQYLTAHFGLTPFQEGLAGASAILGCIPGAMFAGFPSDRYGRRRILFVCGILFAVSGVWSAIPRTFAEFLAARFLSGLGIGAASMVCPIYIAELAPASQRGRLGSLFQLGIVTGILVTLFINARIQGAGDDAWNTATGWRWMFGAEVIPAAGLLVLLIWAPESPRWLVQSGRESEARGILERIGGPAQAEEEIRAVRALASQEEGRLSEIFGSRFRKPLIVAVALMAISQFSGINAIIYYSTQIFTTAGVGVKDSFGSSVVVGVVNFIFTFVAIALVDRAGRRPLLIAGMAVQTVCLASVGLMFHASAGGLPLLIGVLGYIAAFAMALGPIPWIVCSEIFPTKIRGRAMSLATFVIWTSCYAVTQTFPVLNASPSVGPAMTFGIYAVCSLVGVVLVAAILPETKGRSLEEIERAWIASESE